MKNEIEFCHIPVMINECIEELKIKQNGIYVDGTLGGAGHGKEIVKLISTKGRLIGIDQDIEAINSAKKVLNDFDNVIYINRNHDDIKSILQDLNMIKVDGILLDLGVSSYQLDEPTRGFSYMQDAPLDMRMNKKQLLTAKTVVNEYSEEHLAQIIYEYGEEKFSRRIAKNICEYRKNKQIDSTGELVKIIEKSVLIKEKGHPAKKTFQAIRIEVNNELKPLYDTVINAIDCLAPGGRLCIITFHSLEDRIVKQAYINSSGICTCPKDLPYCICKRQEKGKIITKKPILPTEEETIQNSRSKSAKLRVFERI